MVTSVKKRSALVRLQEWSTSRTTLAMLDQIVVSGWRFLTTIMIGQTCGSAELGVYTMIFAGTLLIIAVQDAFVTTPLTVFVHQYSAERRPRFAGSVILHSLCLAIISCVLLLAVSALLAWRGASISAPLASLGLSIPSVLLWEFARRHSIAHLRFRRSLFIDGVVASVSLLLLASLVVGQRLSATTALLAVAAGCLSGLSVWWWGCRAEFRINLDEALSDLHHNVRFGIWIFGSQLIGVAHGYAPGLILLTLVGASATGVFSACENIVLLSNPLILAVVNLVAAVAAKRYAEAGEVAVRAIVGRSAVAGSVCVGMFSLVLVVFGDYFVETVYGDDFRGNGAIVSLLAVGAPLWITSNLLSVGLRTVGRPEQDFGGRICGLVVTLFATTALTLQFGTRGAAVGLLAGSLASVAWQVVALYLPKRNLELAESNFEV